MNLVETELAQYLTEDAVAFCASAYRLCQVWDDLIDNGHAAPSEINSAFQDAVLEWNRNKFFNEHHHALTALLGSVILQWHTANAIESAKDQALLPCAYMLRAGVLHLFAFCVYLQQGMDAAKIIAPRIYSMYAEPFDGYMQEINNA